MNKLPMNYNKTVSNLREIARDMLRLEMTEGKRVVRLEITNAINAAKKLFEASKLAHEKMIARTTFAIAGIDPENPDAADLKEKHQKTLDSHAQALTQMVAPFEADMKELEEQLANVDKAIADIQSGETKVCSDALSNRVMCLIARLDVDLAKTALAQHADDEVHTEPVNE